MRFGEVVGWSGRVSCLLACSGDVKEVGSAEVREVAKSVVSLKRRATLIVADRQAPTYKAM